MKPLSDQTSEYLCAIIISNRYLNLYKEESIKAMEELSSRRQNGDNFDYESFIDNKLKDLPDLNFKNDEMNNIINNLKGIILNNVK